MKSEIKYNMNYTIGNFLCCFCKYESPSISSESKIDWIELEEYSKEQFIMKKTNYNSWSIHCIRIIFLSLKYLYSIISPTEFKYFLYSLFVENTYFLDDKGYKPTNKELHSYLLICVVITTIATILHTKLSFRLKSFVTIFLVITVCIFIIFYIIFFVSNATIIVPLSNK